MIEGAFMGTSEFDDCTFSAVCGRMFDEISSGQEQHGGFNSMMEAAAVLREEHDELWHEIKHFDADSGISRDNLFNEAIQVAAVALRIALAVKTQKSQLAGED